MAAIATLEELRKVQESLDHFREQYPEGYNACAELLRAHRKIGYKNICKMLLGETTPEKLKQAE
jgi:uncharacterized membrane-anchored protein YhcB (DUF1043 family)